MGSPATQFRTGKRFHEAGKQESLEETRKQYRADAEGEGVPRRYSRVQETSSGGEGFPTAAYPGPP